MKPTKKVLIIGVFRSSKTKDKIPCSSPEYLTNLFHKAYIDVLTTSKYVNRISRFFDTIFTILFYSNEYDIAIVPWFNGRGSYIWQEIASRLLKLLSKKVVLVIRGGGIPDLIDRYPHKYLRTLQRVDLVICPSTFISSRLVKHRINNIVIENPLDLSKYPFHSKENFALNLLWMRTLEPLYNPVMAMEVAKILKEKNLPFSLYIAGQNNGQLKELIELQKKYQLEKEVTFCGFINHEQKLEMVRKCDLYICTNNVDNAPVSFIEMMSLGVPIVSTNVGGIPHFITDNKNGFLVNVNDARTMADKLLEIHLCPSIGKTFAENGFEFSRKFSEKSVLEKWSIQLNLLRGLVIKQTTKTIVLQQGVSEDEYGVLQEEYSTQAK